MQRLVGLLDAMDKGSVFWTRTGPRMKSSGWTLTDLRTPTVSIPSTRLVERIGDALNALSV